MSPKNTSSNSSLSGRAIFFMCLLTIQFGIQPMLTRKFTPSAACKTSVIIVQELLKFTFAMSMLLISGGFKSAIVGWTIISWLKVAALPAFLYSIQNICALLAYQNLDGVTFNVLNQTKTLSAALCCYLLMGKTQTRIQILALFLLLGSALIIEKIISIDFIIGQIIEDTTTTTATTDVPSSISNQHFTHGVIPVLIASFLSGLAGAISQKNLQTNTTNSNTNNTKPSSTGRNPYLFSAELCVASTLILTTSLLFVQDGTTISEVGFFHGWTIPTLIPITTNAIGGIIGLDMCGVSVSPYRFYHLLLTNIIIILPPPPPPKVGLVTKYAGSVRKGFALIFGMLVSGMVQSGEGGGLVSKEQIVGGACAAVSLWMHATNPQRKEKVVKQD